MGILYSNLKIFRFPEKLRSLAGEAPLSAPLHVRLKPTNRCNHRCRYCAYRSPDLQLGQHMNPADSLPREKALEIARDLVEMGVRAVTFSGGGEPLVYPYLLEMADIMADGGIKLACLTNGGLLNGRAAEFFAAKASWLRVSMDGWDDDSYGRYRGVAAGEFSRIMANLAAFTRLGGSCLLGVSYIVDAENWPHIPEMLARLKDSGIRSVKVSACIVANEAEANNAYHAPHFEAARNLLNDSMVRLGGPDFEIQDAWHNLGGHFSKDYQYCPYSQVLTVIGADQAVYPCQDKAYSDDARLGSLADQTFREFWFGGGRQTFLRINPARDCLHHCVSNDRNRLILEYLDLDPEHGNFV